MIGRHPAEMSEEPLGRPEADSDRRAQKITRKCPQHWGVFYSKNGLYTTIRASCRSIDLIRHGGHQYTMVGILILAQLHFQLLAAEAFAQQKCTCHHVQGSCKMH